MTHRPQPVPRQHGRAGKSTVSAGCVGIERLAVHDSDEDGVPSDADTAWRQRDLERWVVRALAYERSGVDLLLTGQSPLGELLAAPSAPQLDGAAVCLLDVDDQERCRRLEARDPGVWSDEAKRGFVSWARWHRGHALDPGDRPEAIITGSWPGMRWARWSGWRAGDPRWQVTRIDTTGRSVLACSAELRRWVDDVRQVRDRD